MKGLDGIILRMIEICTNFTPIYLGKTVIHIFWKKQNDAVPSLKIFTCTFAQFHTSKPFDRFWNVKSICQRCVVVLCGNV